MNAIEVAGVTLAFGMLAVPALLTLALVLAARRWFPSPEELEPPPTAIPAGLGRAFGTYLAAASLVGLGVADWALVAFHGGKSGLVSLSALPLLYAGAMGVDALAALGFGHAFDRLGPGVLALSCVVGAIAAPLVFLGASLPALLAGAALWAVALGAQESVYKAAIARLVPAVQRAPGHIAEHVPAG